MLAKSTEYAIRALVYIQIQSWKYRRAGVSEIAREIEAPESYSAKILQILTKHKLLESIKGRGGGFFFKDYQSNLSLYDVIHVMEGDTCFHKCGIGLKRCNHENPCPLHDKYEKVRNSFHQIVQSESIHSLSMKVVEGKAVLHSIEPELVKN
jgi:Rrf2 family protein